MKIHRFSARASCTLLLVALSVGQQANATPATHEDQPTRTSFQAYQSRANENWNAGKGNDAIDDISQAIKYYPGRAKGYETRGSWFYYVGEFEKSIEDLNKARDLAPKNMVTYVYLGRDYRALKQYEKEIAIWTTAIKRAESGGFKHISLTTNGTVRPNGMLLIFYGQRGDAYEMLGKQELALKDRANLRALGYFDAKTPDLTGTQTTEEPESGIEINDVAKGQLD